MSRVAEALHGYRSGAAHVPKWVSSVNARGMGASEQRGVREARARDKEKKKKKKNFGALTKNDAIGLCQAPVPRECANEEYQEGVDPLPVCYPRRRPA